MPAVRERGAPTRKGHRLHYTQELRRADGSTFLAEIRTAPLRNAAGRYEGSVALVIDITARHHAETQAHLRATLLDSIGEAVAAATPDGKVVYINAATERLLGWRPGEVIGRDGPGLFAAPEASEEAARIHAARLKRKRYAGRLKMSRRDGTQFVAHLTSGPALDEHGTLVGVVAVISDETERDQRDRQLRTLELQAETLALLGAQALRQRMDLSDGATLIVTEAVEATRRLVGADRAIVLEMIEGANELQVRAASPDIEEQVVVPAGSRSFAGYITLARRVVVVDDSSYDRRFDACETPITKPTASAIGAPIFGPDGIVGVLTAESATPNRFDHGDAHFMQGMANIIGTALLP